VAPQQINQWLWQQNLVAYSSVGMRSARMPGARQASYKMLAGSAVEGALLPSESRRYAVGHLIARRLQGTTHIGLGVSIGRSKVWETTVADSLLDFHDWCKTISLAISTAATVQTTAPNLQLALPTALVRFPDRPLAIVLDPSLLQGNTSILLPGVGALEVTLFEFVAERIDDDRLRIVVGYEDAALSTLELHIDGTLATVAGSVLSVRHEGQLVDLEELLFDDPPWVYFGDGSSTYGSVLLCPPADLPPLPPELLHSWDFLNANIRAEARNPGVGRITVQQRARDWIEANLQPAILIVDDAAYEIADLVAIETGRGVPLVHFFHCKFSSEDAPGNRVEDLHELFGQAVRSARWTDSGACWRELARRVHSRATTTIVGGTQMANAEQLIDSWAAQPPGLEVQIWAVQPGLSVGGVAGWPAGKTLALAAMEWCATQGATLTIVGSA
jgi:hypothetical protein